MEQGEGLQFKEFTLQQRLNFLRKRLERTDPDDLSGGALWVNLLLPGEAPWGEIGRRRIPPQKGRFVQFTYDKHRSTPDGFILDFTSTTPVTGVSYARFPLTSLEIGTDDKFYIDCKRLVAASGIQAELPNLFVEKISQET